MREREIMMLLATTWHGAEEKQDISWSITEQIAYKSEFKIEMILWISSHQVDPITCNYDLLYEDRPSVYAKNNRGLLHTSGRLPWKQLDKKEKWIKEAVWSIYNPPSLEIIIKKHHEISVGSSRLCKESSQTSHIRADQLEKLSGFYLT